MSRENVVDVDAERVLVLLDVKAAGRGSGIDVSMGTGNLYTIRGGQIVGAVGYPTSARRPERLD